MKVPTRSRALSLEEDGTAGAEEPAFEAELREYAAVARGRWPAFGIDELEFVGYVRARSANAQLQPMAHAPDLLLACACCRGVDSALEVFQLEYGPVIDRVLSHRKAAAHVADDVRQIVQQRLLVGDPEKGISSKSPTTEAWGRSRAGWPPPQTTLLMHLRTSSRRREQSEDSEGAALGVQLDPELEYMKQHYKVEVEQAIVQALDGLSDRIARSCACTCVSARASTCSARCTASTARRRRAGSPPHGVP